MPFALRFRAGPNVESHCSIPSQFRGLAEGTRETHRSRYAFILKKGIFFSLPNSAQFLIRLQTITVPAISYDAARHCANNLIVRHAWHSYTKELCYHQLSGRLAALSVRHRLSFCRLRTPTILSDL
eukprot:8934589-Pyramimonas_sp.AAC.1